MLARTKLLFLASAAVAASLAVPVNASNDGLAQPEQPMMSVAVELDGWSGLINLFGDHSAEISTGESLGAWSVEDNDEGGSLRINMGSYGNGSELTLSYGDTFEEGEVGLAQLEIAGGGLALGLSTVIAEFDPQVGIHDDIPFRPAPGTEHPPGNPVDRICKRTRGGSSVYIVKLRNGKEAMILPPNAGNNHGEGFYQLDGKVYFVKWKGRIR
ncbi:MAG: hypothetical protein AAF957_21870 [Planctomycetota bacterium]